MSESAMPGRRPLSRRDIARSLFGQGAPTPSQVAVDANGEAALRERRMQSRNARETYLLVAGIGFLTAVSALLLWGWIGMIAAAAAVAALAFLAPGLPPEAVMRLYRARPLDPRHGAQILRIVGEISRRAGLAAPPAIHLVPSATLNAFAVGRPGHATIALTEGMLRKLSLRELTGVIAHEISHIRNHDLRVMGLADLMTRFTQIMAWTALALVLINLPSIFTGATRVPWLPILLLYLAPTLGSLLQLALSRTREYDADLDGAALTGDPMGLASALGRIERYQGHLWEDLVPGGRRIPQPSVLRSHPRTEDRIARLRSVDRGTLLPPIEVAEEPMVSLVGFGPIAMRPRYRFPGVWF